jgi:hypothetical protein
LLREHDIEDYYLEKISLLDTTFYNPRFGVHLRNGQFDEALTFAIKKWHEQVSAEGINSFWGITA